MKKQIWVIVIAVMLCSCLPTETTERFNTNPDSIVTHFDVWWKYHYQNVNLTQNYLPLDTAGNEISKESFLKQLSSGSYIVLRPATANDSLQYQLYKIPQQADKDISSQIKQLGSVASAWHKMEGTTIPDFNFTDLNGNVYNEKTTKGKVVVIKCWFIHCQVCVEEMPALNEIVRQYKNRKDILFISLAFDTKEQLQKFLTTIKFEYAVVPVSQEYLTNKLGIMEYPTQIILSKTGTIAKVFSRYTDMIPVLQQELAR